MPSSSQKTGKFLSDHELDGFLILGDSLCNLDIYYLSSFKAPDRFALLAASSLSILVSGMEEGRAKKESAADEVVSTSDYGIMEKLARFDRPQDAYIAVLKEFLNDRGVKRLGVFGDFPVGVYLDLAADFRISVLESPVSRWRETKSPEEIEAIRSAQRACEGAMNVAIKMISNSRLAGDYLALGGEPLTSEKVKSAIEVFLLERGCEAQDTIVAGGRNAADPHSCGSGPLPANSPIVIDIFPRSKRTRYYADMTRTVLRGEADPEVVEIYGAVLAAQEAGIAAVRDGATGREVHARVCQVFEERGYPERDGRGFIHSTGHGVGLAIHERPSLSEVGGTLTEGNVVTVEPGLYYPELGGVRLEDLLVVREDGCENLTRLEKRLIL
ncbi:MAG TPA: Xaa-Pro peptidase family protein [Methanothrix sp.]|nr:Xaa-Pro peptidase family protein [Methanothrix sp.]HRW83696.1 Xaa-Pro peptidase family protein [Methanothrix sp.]